MESRWIYGVHVESIWNLWGRVKYRYSIYILDMNMRSGSHALLHVEKSEKNGVLRVLQILHVRLLLMLKKM